MTDRPATEPPPCKHCGATGPFPRSHKYIPPEGGAPRACNCNAEMYGNGDRHSDDCATGLGAAPRAEGLDEAWAAAESALPEGWHIYSVHRSLPNRPLAWSVVAHADDDLQATEAVHDHRGTLIEALSDLAARLSRPSDERVPGGTDDR